MDIEIILNSRKKSVSAIARLLSLSRPTVYDRIDKKNWNDYEIKILKKNNLI